MYVRHIQEDSAPWPYPPSPATPQVLTRRPAPCARAHGRGDHPPAGGTAPRPASRSCGLTRCGSPSRRSTSTPPPTASWRRSTRAAESSTGERCAPRSSTSSANAARCRTPSPARAACSSAPSTRSGRTARWASRSATGSRPSCRCRSPRWPSPTASRAGTAGPSRCPRRVTPSSSAAASRPRCPTTSTRTWRSWSWTSAAPRPSSSGSWGSTPPAGVAPTVAVLGGAGKSGSLSLAAARAAGAGRTIGVVPGRARAPPAARPAGSPTRSSSPTRARPLGLSDGRGGRRAARPT